VAAGYLLDSCIIVPALKGEPRALLNRLAGIASNRLYLSSIVLAELYLGAEKSRDPAPRKADIADLTQGMTPLPFDADCASTYGRIRAHLERKGSTIGPMDLLIAAQAVSAGLILVTDNLREFKRVPGLRCENWLRASRVQD
jgi:tRNA(fMet)-specific endonuclease VapC